MSRNAKSRRVCAEFTHKVFTPEDFQKGFITMNVDELEAIRFCDLEGLDQEEAAKRMDISRGTLQRILYSARAKSAEALCEGKGIIIEGGNYSISGMCCKDKKRCRRCEYQ